MKVSSHLDFQRKAQIIQITLQKVSSLPSPGWKGGVVFLESDNTPYYHDGSKWVAINDTDGLITTINAGGGIIVTGSGQERKVTFDPDNNTLETEAGDQGKARIKNLGVATQHIKDQNITNPKLSHDAVHTVNILDKAVTFTKMQDIPSMTVVGNVSASAGSPDGVLILTSLDEIISAHNSLASAKAVKDYVDNLVGGIGSLMGGWSAASNNNFPSGASKGDYWYITDDGTIQGIEFVEGDVIIANTNSPSVSDPSDWIALKTKRGQATTTKLGLVKLATTGEARAMENAEKALTPSNLSDVRASNEEAQGSSHERFVTPQGLHNRTATTTRRGIAELATQAEVNQGTDNQRIVTPATLHVFVSDFVGAYGQYVANMGNGSATTFTITHGFDTKDVVTEVFSNATGETVLVDTVRAANGNSVIVNFCFAPSSNEYRIVIRK